MNFQTFIASYDCPVETNFVANFCSEQLYRTLRLTVARHHQEGTMLQVINVTQLQHPVDFHYKIMTVSSADCCRRPMVVP